MTRQLVFLMIAVVATLGQTDVSQCCDLFDTDGKCQNETTALLQVVSVPETFPFQKIVTPKETDAKTSKDDSGGPLGPTGPKHQKDPVMTSMKDWHSSRDLAHVWAVHDVTISPNLTVQIFSAVPVFGKDETYIALLLEPFNLEEEWVQYFHNFVMFCAGPDGSHKTQVKTRGNTWVCAWPREELDRKQFKVLLEDENGTHLGMVLAENDPTLLGQYKTMACVRDIYYVESHKRNRAFSGPFKQWVEWMEWSSMHGLEHFLFYTFEGTDLAAIDVMKPYLDAGIASRVHFQYYHPHEMVRQFRFMNDCLYRAKTHAQWLATSVDVDEYVVFPGEVKYFNWDHILKTQGVLEDKVASLVIRRVRFARARPEFFEISSDHREPTLECCWPKQFINVDNVYLTGIHRLQHYKNGTTMIRVDPKLAIIRHYKLPDGSGDYDKVDFKDPKATMTDETLQKDMPLLEGAIAKRFNIQATAVKGFLKNLAQRRVPDADAVAAAHKD